MSSSFESGSSGHEDKVCRDFLRNVCHRGNRCKFLHPQDAEQPNTSQHHPKHDLLFCHDFQNGLCPRQSCRFIHCTVGEEEYYLKTGQILPHLLEQATMLGQIINMPNGAAPICKDFLMGDCLRKRGGKCRFRHLTKAEYEEEVFAYKNGEEESSHVDHSLGPPPQENGGSMPPDSKRQRFEVAPPSSEFLREVWDREFLRPVDEMSRLDHLPREMSLREFRDRDRELDRERDRRGFEEILLLRKQLETLKKEIASLKKENSDLRATNDFLLEKVTTMNKGGGTVTTVTVPTVSLASTIPVATSVRPLTAAQVSHPLSISSECSVGSVGSVVAMPPPPQAQAPPQPLAPPTQPVGVAPPPTAVLGSVGGVQVSLSQAPALTAVSLSTVNLNPSIAPATSLAPTIAPSIAPPPPISAPLNLAPSMSMSGASGHLVSYPIMTQPGLRPQIQ